MKRLADLFDHRIRVGYSRTELVRDRDEIQHPAVRECLRYLDLDGGLRSTTSAICPRAAVSDPRHRSRSACCTRSTRSRASGVRPNSWRRRPCTSSRICCGNASASRISICARGGFGSLVRADGVAANLVPILPARLAELERSLLLLYTGMRGMRTRFSPSSSTTPDLARRHGSSMDERARRRGPRVLTAPGRSLNDFGELLQDLVPEARAVDADQPGGIDDWYESGASRRGRRRQAAGRRRRRFSAAAGATREAGSCCRAVPDLRRVPFEFDRTGGYADLLQSLSESTQMTLSLRRARCAPPGNGKRTLVTGASGFVGRNLSCRSCARLAARSSRRRGPSTTCSNSSTCAG